MSGCSGGCGEQKGGNVKEFCAYVCVSVCLSVNGSVKSQGSTCKCVGRHGQCMCVCFCGESGVRPESMCAFVCVIIRASKWDKQVSARL